MWGFVKIQNDLMPKHVKYKQINALLKGINYSEKWVGLTG